LGCGGGNVGTALGGVGLTTYAGGGGDLYPYGLSGGDGAAFGGLVTGEGLGCLWCLWCSWWGGTGVGHDFGGEGGGRGFSTGGGLA